MHSHGGERWIAKHPRLRVVPKFRELGTDIPIRSSEWWVASAVPYDMRECPKCGGMTRSGYYSGRDTLGECGVIEHCGMCGWEKVHLSGRHGRPYHD